MKKLLPLLLMSALSASAQPFVAPAGGGHYDPQQGVCVTPERYTEINAMLQRNTDMLVQQGVLPGPGAKMKTTATTFSWPLKQAAGYSYNALYGVSNFVDNNLMFPNQVRDWNCGTRTYDQGSGYNHGGMDIFLWPFDINMMDAKQAEIVAAADGIIIAKEDGNFDKNCAMGSGNWNAVYVKHADGVVTWYGHMKSGTQTTKAVGASVSAGEYLGTVGSSGSSTGPHLHFEVHDAGGNVIDPYNGPCNSSASMWKAQKPYVEPTINAIMTHSAPPVLNPCPQPHTPNMVNVFAPGQQVFFAVYFHDNIMSDVTQFKIYDPNGMQFGAWSHSPTTPYYVASYYYWYYTLPFNAPKGQWRYEAKLNGGATVTHNFYVYAVDVNDVAQTSSISVYPNPAKDHITIADYKQLNNIRISNTLGQVIFTAQTLQQDVINTANWPAGMYILHAEKDGAAGVVKFVVER